MIARDNINSFWASLVVEELVRQGIHFFCISPGSRSAPLTIAAARHPQTDCQVCHDERGAAFLALGYARAAGKLAALICTSGTAAANYFPAVVESAMDAVPMLLLTADRPPELLDTTANQAIHQQKLYGDYPRWQFTFPTPSEKISPRFVLTTIDQAVYRAQHPLPGPVHVNFMFRDPLTPTPEEFSLPPDAVFEKWENSQTPFTTYAVPEKSVAENELAAIAKKINGSANGVVLIGRLAPKIQRAPAIAALLKKLGWPVHADIASGFRLGKAEWPVLDERLFYSEDFFNSRRAETVLHLGGPFLSKKIQQWLEKFPPRDYLLVHNDPRRIDPAHLVTRRIDANPVGFCAALVKKLGSPSGPDNVKFAVLQKGIERETTAGFSTEDLSEPATAYWISRLIPPDHGLFLGNSMPVRDMNTFAATTGASVHVATNRGASGIDGNIATAVGFARGLHKPVTLLLGDVAALHDLNSLYVVKKSREPIIAVVLNNDGGGIFSFLPISKHDDIFQPYFETPHGLSFQKAAEMFGLAYALPATLPEFQRVYEQSCQQRQSILIEINTDKQANYALHKNLQRKIGQLIDSSR